jgi:hypothetical protein
VASALQFPSIMRMTSIAVCAALGVSGCSAAGSAIGGVLSPKPPQVTVVQNVETSPVVEHAPQTVVVVKERPRGKSLMEKIGIVTTSTVVGAGAGALVGDAMDGDVGGAAFLGAVAGAMAGVAIAKD